MTTHLVLPEMKCAAAEEVLCVKRTRSGHVQGGCGWHACERIWQDALSNDTFASVLLTANATLSIPLKTPAEPDQPGDTWNNTVT